MGKLLPCGTISEFSLNKYRIIKPIKNAKNDWCGCTGEEVWSHSMLRSWLQKRYPEINMNEDTDVVDFLYRCEGSMKWVQDAIVYDISEGFASLLHSLQSELLNLSNANYLSADDKLFWYNCRNVFLVGGLAFGQLGKTLEVQINHLLRVNGCKAIQVKCIEDKKTEELSMLGCASLLSTYNNCIYTLDFGNTAVKQGVVIFENGKYRIESLETAVRKRNWDLEDSINSAKELHAFIMKTILRLLQPNKLQDNSVPSVGICIANNTVSGSISNRGGYRCLRLLSDNYMEYLKTDLEVQIGKRCTISFVNDAYAVACMFRKWTPNAAVVTLGTYLGIAYPL